MFLPIRRTGAPLTALALLFALLAPSAAASSRVDVGTAFDSSRSVLILADSVALGSRDLVSQQLPGHEISMFGFPGVTVGDGPTLIDAFSGAVGDVAVVALGYNIRSWNPQRYATEIDRVVEALVRRGAKQVVWIGLREPTRQTSGNGRWTNVQLGIWGDTWVELNAILREALARNPELSIAEWDDVANDATYVTDSIHLTTKGRRAMAETIAQAVLEVPLRVVGTVTVPVAGRGAVPTDAAAAWVRVTATNTRMKTNVAVHACGEEPGRAQFNAGILTAAGTAALVPLDETGNMCITASHLTHLSVDVQGWTTPDDGLARTSLPASLPTWTGVVDAGESVTLDTNTFNEAPTLALRVEARGSNTNGSVRVHPCGSPRSGSALAFAANQRSADLHLVSAAGDGLCVTSTQRARISITQTATDASLAQRYDQRRVLSYGASTAADVVTHRVVLVDPADGPNDQPVLLSLRTRNAQRNASVDVHRCRVAASSSHAAVAVVGRASTATVMTSPDVDGAICVTAPGDTDLIVDVIATLAAGQLHATPPFEVFDSRLRVQRDPTIDLARQRPSPTDEPFAFRSGD